MPKDNHTHLSRRERQIMDILYQQGEATAKEVLGSLPNPPSYSAVRALLSKLESKGHISHKDQGAKYIYFATLELETAQDNALKRVLKTFFDDSPLALVNALLGSKTGKLSEKDADELKIMIEKAKKRNG